MSALFCRRRNQSYSRRRVIDARAWCILQIFQSIKFGVQATEDKRLAIIVKGNRGSSSHCFHRTGWEEDTRYPETPQFSATEALTRLVLSINQNLAFEPGTYVHGDITLPPVNAIAAKDASCKLWLAITNLDPNQSVEVEASLTGITAKSASGEILAGPKVDSINSFEAPSTVVPKAISPKVKVVS